MHPWLCTSLGGVSCRVHAMLSDGVLSLSDLFCQRYSCIPPALLSHASAGSCLCLHLEDHHDRVREYSYAEARTPLSKNWGPNFEKSLHVKQCRFNRQVLYCIDLIWGVKRWMDCLRWDPSEIDFSRISVGSTELTEKDHDGQSAIYWEVKYPFPLSNRDVSYWNISQSPISLLNCFLKDLFDCHCHLPFQLLYCLPISYELQCVFACLNPLPPFLFLDTVKECQTTLLGYLDWIWTDIVFLHLVVSVVLICRAFIIMFLYLASKRMFLLCICRMFICLHIFLN